MNKVTTALLAFSLLLLGGAFIASRVMLADVTVPPVPPPVAAPIAVAPAPPTPVAVAPPVAMPPPLPTDVPVAAPPEPPPAVPTLTTTPVNIDSDYALEDSPKVEEAWKLAKSKDPAAWRTAEKLFKRCLVQVPDNQRCQSGLAAVQGQLSIGRQDSTPELAPSTVPTKGPRPKHGSSYEE